MKPHPPPATPAAVRPEEPRWRVAGPVAEDARQRLMGILTCAAVRARIQRRVLEHQASKRWPADDGDW